MAKTYTVVKGDTLSELAIKFKTTVSNLVSWNKISNPDFIVIGQKLYVDGPNSELKYSNAKYMPTITVFGLQSNTDRTVYATWLWDKSQTKNYSVVWQYYIDGVWFAGESSETTYKYSTYNAPTNSKKVRFKVKANAKGKEDIRTGYSLPGWTGQWSSYVTYDFSNNPPSKPSTPTVKVENYKLTASLTNIASDINATGIQFQIVKNDSTVFNTGKATIVTNSASYSCNINVGDKYKVRCRAYRGSDYSEWSDYSDNVSTKPSTPAGFTKIRANSETSVYLEWNKVNSAESYDIEYTTKKEYFDGSDQTSTVTGIEFTKYEKTGLESGNEYFFRIRAVNENGESAWSEIKSVVIGTVPAAPTTWSNTTTVIVGEELILYWMHNSEDGSNWTYSQLDLEIGGVKTTYDIQNKSDDEEENTYSYKLDTSSYTEGTTVQWRVRTAGITKQYGEYSVERTIDIYAPPTLQLSVTNSSEEQFEVLESFPFYVEAIPGPDTQVPTGYHVTVSANEGYETVDNLGNTKLINRGEEVYSKYFDIASDLMVEFSASNVNLENGISYTITCSVSMNSGLTTESTFEFTVGLADVEYEPNAEIGINLDDLTASIRPYCVDENDIPIEGVKLSVYRREFDGTFIELGTDLENISNTFITDPHPALDYARYRIVATDEATGAVSFVDLPGIPVECNAAVIQWNEEWTSFDVNDNGDVEVEPSWTGSMLKLPYNIDVSDNYKPDVSLVKYIGRDHPVTYYGTQKGSSSSWNMEIPKYDTETLYALRRLAIWMGDCYVREPSGSGYWANVTVSFSQKHCEVTIPVTLNITRVTGGV